MHDTLHRALPRLLLLFATAAPAAAQLGSLATTFADNNGRSSTPPVNLMDMTITNPAGIRFVAVDVNSMAAVSTPIAIEIYMTPTTYVGNELNAVAWVKISEGSGIAQGRGTPTPIDVRDFHLPAGSYGIGISYLNGGSAYTNGANTYSNTDLSLSLGSVTAAFFSSTLFNPRTWNGTWYYFIGNATYGTFGRGCAHASGTPTLAAAPGSLPRLGGTFTLQLGNLDPLGLPALLAIGLDNTTLPLGALPLGLAFLGAPGCELLVDPATNLLVLNQSGSGTVVTGIPNNAAFVGVALYHQGLVLSAGANALNAVVTNGGEGFLGN